ncbi:MAG TPA: menaquinone biosynthesis protein [Candidatus Krumholzibacteria bacterium]|nr:menaquinone biosynthesis protein [Candidatus Krumholzibacteria bacterium]
MTRIGKIPYLNSILFFHRLENEPDVRLEPLVPRALSSAVAEGEVDAGPVPLVTTWEIEDRFSPLGDFCISSIDRARSILFFSKRPFDRLDGAVVGVTNETSTSVRLMKALLMHAWRVRPARFTHVDWPNNDAFLLIGDEALIHRRGVKDYPHVADLGEVWYKWTGLPFVFARWMVRTDLPDADKARLVEMLDTSIAEGWKHFERVVAPRAGDLNMTIEEMRDYLQGFRFRMTAAEQQAIGKFRQLDAAAREADATTSTLRP